MARGTAVFDLLYAGGEALGRRCTFEARQKRFSFDNRHFFVDLVFYNRLLRCHVQIDLKRGELTHQDLGQMQMYVNYFDRHVKTDDELPTVGILLCDRKNDAVVELTLPEDVNIYASKYNSTCRRNSNSPPSSKARDGNSKNAKVGAMSEARGRPDDTVAAGTTWNRRIQGWQSSDPCPESDASPFAPVTSDALAAKPCGDLT